MRKVTHSREQHHIASDEHLLPVRAPLVGQTTAEQHHGHRHQGGFGNPHGPAGKHHQHGKHQHGAGAKESALPGQKADHAERSQQQPLGRQPPAQTPADQQGHPGDGAALSSTATSGRPRGPRGPPRPSPVTRTTAPPPPRQSAHWPRAAEQGAGRCGTAWGVGEHGGWGQSPRASTGQRPPPARRRRACLNAACGTFCATAPAHPSWPGVRHRPRRPRRPIARTRPVFPA